MSRYRLRHQSDIARHIREHQIIGPASLGLTSPMDYKGSISVNTDFPTNAAVSSGDYYTVLADVTDDDPTRTNTGDSFSQYDEIVWNGTGWTNLGNSGHLVDNQYFVGKHGNDTWNGKSPGSARLTLAFGLSLASAGDIIYGYPGDYSENITVPENVTLFAPGVHLQGTITVGDGSRVYIGKQTVADGTTGVSIAGSGDYAVVEIAYEQIVNAGGNGYVNTESDAHLVFRTPRQQVENGHGCALTTAGPINVDIGTCEITGSGTVIEATTDAYIYGYIGRCFGSHLALASNGIMLNGSAYADLTIDRLETDVAYNINSNARFKANIGTLSGTSTGIAVINGWARTEVDVASYTTTDQDRLLGVTRTSTGTCAISVRTEDIRLHRRFTIVDEGGNAGANNITVTCAGGETISGQASLVIEDDYNVVHLYSDGSNLFVGD